MPRWQAIGLLHRFGGYQVGKTFLVDRLDLIRQLEEIAAGKQFEFETVRHERVVIQVDKTRKYRQATAVTIPRVLTRFVLKYTLRAAHLELGGVDLDLAVEDDVLPLDRADMTQQVGVEREVRRGGKP